MKSGDGAAECGNQSQVLMKCVCSHKNIVRRDNIDAQCNVHVCMCLLIKHWTLWGIDLGWGVIGGRMSVEVFVVIVRKRSEEEDTIIVYSWKRVTASRTTQVLPMSMATFSYR